MMEKRTSCSRESQDYDRRYSFASTIPSQSSGSLSRVAPSNTIREGGERSESRGENILSTPPRTPLHEPENIFADPRDDTRPSSRAESSDFGSEDMTINQRNSLALSVPRSLSPTISVADGGWGYRHSLSLTRSASPSVSASSIGLRRSNTAATDATQTTTNSSTLYSIPSHISGLSSHPASIRSIAPVRPRFDYSGHQQTLSMGGSELGGSEIGDIGEGDPFIDSYEVPVADGFAPHAQRPPPSSAASDNGSFGSLPPPYTQYPGFATPKPEDEIDLGVSVQPIITVSEVGMGPGPAIQVDDGGRIRRRRESRRTMPLMAGTAGVAGMQSMSDHPGGSDPEISPSGAHKEWHQRRILGGRAWVLLLGGLLSLLIGIAVGLGVGLGIGQRNSRNGYVTSQSVIDLPNLDPSNTSLTSSFTTATKWRPTPEQTAPPKSDPDGKYPDIPVGEALVNPIELKTLDAACAVTRNSVGSPDYFRQGSNGLWSCSLPEGRPMMWDVGEWPASLAHAELSKIHSVPDTLTCAEWENGLWGSYLLSSEEGEYARDKRNVVFETPTGERVWYAAEHGWREGMVNPSFYRQPLAFRNVTWRYDPTTNTHSKRDSNGTTPLTTLSYNFGILYNKTVILRETTMIETHNTGGENSNKNGNGSELLPKEKVWMCIWEKTLLEVELMINEPSISALKATAQSHNPGNDTDSEDEDGDGILTTITVGLPLTTPTPSSTASPTADLGAPAPVSPPKPSDGNLHGNLSQIGKHFQFGLPGPPGSGAPPGTPSTGKRNIQKRATPKGPRHFSKKIYMKESRPTPDRLRRVLGIDRTDLDPDGRAVPGNVRCRKMLVMDDGGLVEFKPEGEEVVSVILSEEFSDPTLAAILRRSKVMRGRNVVGGEWEGLTDEERAALTDREKYEIRRDSESKVRRDLEDKLQGFPADTGCSCTWES
jgi:hypothetical protein